MSTGPDDDTDSADNPIENLGDVQADADPGLPPRLIYQQGACLAVWKPAGILTQAPPQIDSLELRLKRFLKHRDRKAGRVYLGIVHRLDRPVSGVLLFGTNERATRRMADQFAARTVAKTYWALVEGAVQPRQGTWRDPVRKVPGQARAEVVPPDHPEARQAVLHYRVLGGSSKLTWLEIELETGRTHQIRVQCQHHGHPITGDFQYGAQHAFGPPTEDERARWIGLHARHLRFRHPHSREFVEVEAALPAPWCAADVPSVAAAMAQAERQQHDETPIIGYSP